MRDWMKEAEGITRRTFMHTDTDNDWGLTEGRQVEMGKKKKTNKPGPVITKTIQNKQIKKIINSKTIDWNENLGEIGPLNTFTF